MSAAIEVEGLSKLYRRTAAGHRLRTLKSALLERSLVGGLRPEEAIPALEGVSFTVAAGEAVGVLGSNGSGKSTLLKTLAGILKPTSGRVSVAGRTAALIELGAGFHPEISGRENVFINGAVLGLSRREVRRRYVDIVEFSGLADFIDEPVKNYSSGMYVRLGFAVAIHTDPDVLMVDDVQFIAGKESTQEEFFHTFNALLEGQQQVILTCDRYPKEVNGLEERLKSRFGWGLTAAIEPAELETRVAILMSKAQQSHIDLPDDVAFFIAKRIQSNIRELEGALRRVVASARFTGRPISLEITREALRDLLVLQDKLVTIDNIQKTVAEYFQIRVADLNSGKRSRSIARRKGSRPSRPPT